MRNPAFASVLVVLSLIGRQDLFACSCVRRPPVCEAAWQADAVFLGTVTSIAPLTVFGFPLALHWPDEFRVKFAVKEQFGGPAQKTIEVGTAFGCCACGIEFQRGKEYLVYALRDHVTGSLHTSICTRTANASDAADDLAYLRSLKSSTPPAARIYGFITGAEMDLRAEKATVPVGGTPVLLRMGSNEWRTSTDASGNYEFQPLQAGTYSLTVNLPHKLSAGDPHVISLPEHGCSFQPLMAREQAEVRGRIIDAGPSIPTFVALVPVSKGAGKLATGFSNASGAFTISHVSPGDYYLGVNISEPPRDHGGLRAPWQPTYYPGVQRREAATPIHISSAEQLEGFEFKFPPRLRQRTITGFVHWPDGKPASVWVELKDDEFEDNVDLAESGRDGSFSVIGVVDRLYHISATTRSDAKETPAHSPRIDLGISSNGPIRLVLSLPGRD
jgi:hypothetical protein